MECRTRDVDDTYVDNELVRRSRGGDVQAFEQLFERHSGRVYSIALHMLQDETEAADVTQDVFVRVYQGLGKLKADAAFVTWLRTVTVNACRDVLRRRSKIRIESLDAQIDQGDGRAISRELPDWSANPEKSMDEKFMRDVVRSAIGTLSQDYREVVTMFYVDKMDIAGIAEVLGSPVGTIKSKLSRARAELKRKLECYVK